MTSRGGAIERRRRCALALATAALGLALASPVPALPPPEERWLQVTTPGFTLLSNAPQATAVKMAADLERLRHTLSQLASGERLTSPLPTCLFVFRDSRSFAPYRLPGKADPMDVGYLVPHEHGTYGALLGAPEGNPSRYVYKQYIHQLLQQRWPQLPLWFRQGLAELYSSFEVREGEARVGLPIREHVLRLRAAAGRLLPVEDLFAWREGPASPLAAGTPPPPASTTGPFVLSLPAGDLLFPQSWALTHYLLVGNDRLRQKAPIFVGRLLAAEPTEEAFQRVFQVTPRHLEEELAAYVQGDTFRYVRWQVSTTAELEMEVAPLPRWQTLYHLGDLLAHTAPEHRSLAAEHLREASALAPELGPAWARLGYLAELEGRPEEARDLYARAAPLAPDDFLAQYLYGTSLLATLSARPEDEEGLTRLRAAEAALRRATELAGEFIPAWERLGFAYGLEHEPSRQGAEVLEKALALAPARTDVAFNLLLAYARLGERDQVEAVMAILQARGADPRTLARARDVRLQMDFQEANRLLSQDRLGDAAALFARIEAESTSPALSRQAGEQVARVAAAAEHNRFIEGYREAARLYNAGEHPAARAILEGLLAQVPAGGRQEEVVRDLLGRLDEHP